MAKRTLKKFHEVTDASNTSLNTRIWSFLKMAMRFFFAWIAAVRLSRTHRFRRRLHGLVAAFSAILMLHNKTTSGPTALGTINLHKCAQHFAYS